MLSKNKDIKNFIVVVFSNIITILVSLFMGFMIPKLMTVESYAYYRIYCLYIAYAGFFHLGFVNGIYLKYGNLDFAELPKEKFRKYNQYMIAIQAIVVGILSFFLIISNNRVDKGTFVAFVFIIINIPLINCKWFFSSINQFTKRFIEDSYLTFAQALINAILVILIVVFNIYSFVTLLVFITLNNAICMLLAIMQNKKIVFGKSQHINYSEIKPMIVKGFFLMLSEFVGVIILGIDSIFVQYLFTVHDFAMYSFAVSVITTIYCLIATVSNLIYPYLVRLDKRVYSIYYSMMSNVIIVIAAVSFIGFFVTKFIIERWIPKYDESITITSILFATILFRSVIVLVCSNFFKTMQLIKKFTQNNIFSIIITFLLNVIAYIIFGKYQYIAIASLLSFVIWYVVTDQFFVRKLSIKTTNWVKRYIYIFLIMLLFFSTQKLATMYALIVYMVFMIVVSFLFFFKEWKKIISEIRACD